MNAHDEEHIKASLDSVGMWEHRDLMITHDPEEVKDYADRNIHLVRNQDSPWRCFNVHENGQEVSHA
ncbi:ATP-binding protein%2C Mn [Streptococcus pneumoniae]|nr:ATP-binding protein%2C Mn [Streptococcus pneumoniae]